MHKCEVGSWSCHSLPLIYPPPDDALRGWHFVRFNFMVAKSCFATLAIVESALDSALAE
ncbi:hypothetical protein [Helicobacter magdeburgensis]|uniref:hypothetical protein n=1 Tax=Helicobacter magdeburgensis TaxID=471858 RepID=UPI00142DEBA3|nr:hypothetical protein [Helicobacter magdeburgensis]